MSKKIRMEIILPVALEVFKEVAHSTLRDQNITEEQRVKIAAEEFANLCLDIQDRLSKHN